MFTDLKLPQFLITGYAYMEGTDPYSMGKPTKELTTTAVGKICLLCRIIFLPESVHKVPATS